MMKIPDLRLQFLCILCALCGSFAARASNEVPAPAQNHDILLSGGTIHPVTSEPIQGDLLFSKGKIVAIGNNLSASSDAVRIDITGKHVYPGFIDAATDIGLTEIGSIRATRDQSETGQINPNARAEVAINPDSELIPVARANGILLAVTAPEGGVISGTSALVQLDGWTWEDMVVKAPVAMEMNWPSMTPARSWRQQQSEREQLRERDERLKQIRQAFADARAYMIAKQKGSNPINFDARWEAMMPLLEGKIPLAVNANEIQQIQGAIAFAQEEKVRLIIIGGADAPLCADLIKKYHVPVILTGTQRLPTRRWSGYDDQFALPQRLRELGIRFCIAGSRSASYVRNLPYQAGMAVAFGLPKDEALKSLTLYPAQILGVDDRLGSLQVGKDATLVVTDGDPLETPTQIEQAYIQGRKIELSSRHTRLWDKYKEKYRQLGNQN